MGMHQKHDNTFLWALWSIQRGIKSIEKRNTWKYYFQFSFATGKRRPACQIHQFSKVNREYSNLYGYVIFMNVSTRVRWSDWRSMEVDFELIENWDSENSVIRSTRTIQRKIFLPNGERNFEGIFWRLQKESNGNISEKVDMTSSPTNFYRLPIYVTHFDKDDYFQSTDVEGSRICFDFKSSRIVPTNYQIKNSNNVVNPKTWVIEGKTDYNSHNYEI